MNKITKSEGTTESERYLAKLCENTFLGLWAYPNLYRDEGISQNGTGKELCDLLVVVGSTIAIFSDKDVAFNSNIDLRTAWGRWYRSAIQDSTRQIRGAEKWIREQPSRIFLDKECKQPFPIPIAQGSSLKIFRILVTHNTDAAVRKHFGNHSSSSFVLRPDICGSEHHNWPFHIGRVDEKPGYIHVFDEASLGLVLRELDTAPDFFDYLDAKEEAFASERVLSTTGEEELLAYYLLEGGHFPRQRIDFPKSVPKKERASGRMVLTEGFWESYVTSPEYRQIKHANTPSYFWDALISRFAGCVMDGTIVGPDPRIATHEEAIRVLANERRLSRRFLAENLISKYQTVPSNHRSGRVVGSMTYPSVGYAFLFFPRDPGEDYTSYREDRQELLTAYIYVCKSKFPRFTTICGIATEPQECDGRSEDILVMEIPSLSPEELKAAEEVSREDQILFNVKVTETKGMLVPARRARKKVGRNEPCPCGSGVKYKKCCGR